VWDRSIQYAREYGLNGSLGTGHRPSTIAAASIYVCGLLFNEKRTQPTVASAAGVSTKAVREAQQRLLDEEGYR